MSETNEKPGENIKIVSIQEALSLGTIEFHLGRVEVIPADSIKVEKSTTPKYLCLQGGYLMCYSRVFASVDGQLYEITVDSLPEEPSA